MIKRWKIVECEWCKAIAPMRTVTGIDDSWWALPEEWTNFDKKIHLCPLCSKAVYKAKLEIESEKNEK